MKAVTFQISSRLTLDVNIEKDFCRIFTDGIPVWCGDRNELIELLEKIWKKGG